ncbi:MAG: thiamine diphosphokinase [Ilumatobacter sp.]|nr:thiamine diphosphokinase [Ilumatobacter sp.]
MNETVIVVTGAAPLRPRAVDAVPPGSIVIAADGALDCALAAGLQPAALVGDLDSVSDAGLAWAEDHATIDRHDPDKEHTDTELALATAVGLDPDRIVLLSGGGDRLDHSLAAIGALGAPRLTSVPTIDGIWGVQRFAVLHGPGRTRLDVAVGTTISLLALHGACEGVTTTGLRWPLESATLEPMSGLGVSNVADAATVEISLTARVLTVFVNDHLNDRPSDHLSEETTT